MLAVGPATKITIHVSEDTSSRSDLLHTEILTFLFRRGERSHDIETACGIRLTPPFTHQRSRTRGRGTPSHPHRVHRKKETVDRLLSELYKDLSVSSTPKRCVTERPKRSIRQNQKVREVAPSGVKKQLIPQAGCS